MSGLNGHEVLRPTKCNPNLGRKDHTINHRITYRLSCLFDPKLLCYIHRNSNIRNNQKFILNMLFATTLFNFFL